MTLEPEGKQSQDPPPSGDRKESEAASSNPGKALEELKKKYEQRPETESRPTLFEYWKKARLWFYALLVCFVLYGIRPYTTYEVPSDATNMHALFPPGTTVLVNKDFRPPEGASESGRTLQYSDCILYEYEHKGRKIRMMGRVVGLQQDKVSVISGRLVLNGRDITESYLTKAVPESSRPSRDGETVVPAGCVYVLNDDRASVILDSRDFGPVKSEQIVGKIVIGNHW